MKKIIFVIGITLLVSCNKSTSVPEEPPGNPNNKVKATISIAGAAPIIFDLNGNNTAFARRIDTNGDDLIIISGSLGDKQLTIMMINTFATGTYTFTNGGTTQYIFCSLGIGNPLVGPYTYYRTGPTPPPTGTITINTLAPGSISGTFNATMKSGSDITEVTNGSFVGSF